MSKRENLGSVAVNMSPPRNHSTANHQSASLPTTPYQHARSLSLSARSPSPVKVARTRSPTTQSESETGLRMRGKGPLSAGCKYETGMAYSRRRIPYSVGGDKLEKASSMPKKFLNPADEDKLSGDMRELYDRLYPSPESDRRRSEFLDKLARILNEQWPGNDIKVHVFGSSGNLLCTDESDVDICITTPLRALERVCLLAKTLAEHGMQRVVCVPHAKVPIVKFWDPDLRLACDMNVNNTLALENTRMIKTYVEIDHRVRPLAMIIKHWTRQRVLNDAALGGTLSSYTWICMILNFLQTRNPPVLPCLHNRPHQKLIGPDGRPSAFADDVVTLRTFGQKNKETLGELLFHFFRRYAHELDYDKYVISIRTGTLISKEEKKWHMMQNNRLCVEEPFNIERNLGNTADDISFRGVHLELRRAFDLVCEAKLEECVKKYEFPVLEERIWEKPPAKPPPVLTPSQPQSARSGRGGFCSRGARHPSNQNRVGPQGRRASSAAASNKFPSSHVIAQALANSKHPLQAQYEQLQLHDQLINEYQYLQAQEHELRLAQAQAQILQVHNSTQTTSSGQRIVRDQVIRPTMNPTPMTAPLQGVPPIYPYPVHPHPHGSIQAIHTNPSSPSMKPVQPELRRSVHRSNPAFEISSASLRSHSQPARPYQMPVALQHPQNLLINGYTPQQVRQHGQFYHQLESQGRLRHLEMQSQVPLQYDSRFDDNLPKEYVGYYVHDSPPHRRLPGENVLPRANAYNEVSYGLLGHPNGIGRLHDPSRSPSPSPLMPSRDRSFSIRSALSTPPDPVFTDQVGTSSRVRNSGPIIVDGSDTHYPNNYQEMIDVPTEGLAREERNSKRAAHVDSRGASGDALFRRAGRSESNASETGQQLLSWAIQKRESQQRLENDRHTAQEPIRRQYPQVNGTAPAPATLRYSSSSINGQGQNMPEKKHSVVSSRDDPAKDEKNQSLPQAKAEVASGSSKTSYDQPLKALPLLSPVREVRTPSPTTSRKEEPSGATRSNSRLAQRYQLQPIPPFSRGLNGRQQQDETPIEHLNGKTLDAASNGQALHPLSNGWQQTTSKKTKKQKPKGSSVSASNGETIPENAAERKGG